MKMIIAGKPTDAKDGATIEVFNPATGARIDNVPSATEADCKRAVSAARRAQIKWYALPLHKRAEIMCAFADLVEKDKVKLSKLLCKEVGKVIGEARAEIDEVVLAARSFSEAAKHRYDTVIPTELEQGCEGSTLVVKREPYGVVLAIIPFNYPCGLFVHKVVPALLMGNSVVIKPATECPLTLCALTALLCEAGVTKGAATIVTGRGSQVGTWLSQNPEIDAITMTGSTKVGIQTVHSAADQVTPVTLELGGNDAFIVCEDADLELASDELMFGRFLNAGQICCGSKRVIVQRRVLEQFEKLVVKKARKVKVGDPLSKDTGMGCLINEAAAKKVADQVALTLEQGGRLLLGGKHKGAFFKPTVITDIPETADVATDMEVFGPVISIIPVDTVEEAIRVANASVYGLSGAVFSKDQAKALDIASQLETGAVVINGASLYRIYEMPFGGWKHSGYGNEGAFTSFDEFTHIKNVVLKGITL